MSLCPVLPYGDPGLDPWLDRQPLVDADVSASVAQILAQVRTRGADAVLDYARRFDAPGLEGLFVSEAEIEAAEVPDDEADAIETAVRRIQEFHEVQIDVLTADWEEVVGGWAWRTAAVDDHAEESGALGQRMIPLQRVGVYVPGGRAGYPSSVVMNAVPARVAGVKEIVLATPPRTDGSVAPTVLVAARALGISTVLKCGGAAAVGALALGIEGLPRVDKIVGRGNASVNEAKRQLWGLVGLDGFAGPSARCVLAFDDADPGWAAADWLSQIERSEEAVGVLLTLSHGTAERVLEATEGLLAGAEREPTLRRALADQGVVVVCGDVDQAFDFVNRLAPEQLSLMTEGADEHVGRVRNAGCLVLGHSTPQSAGDFVCGPSHTLPTAGAARFAGPVSVLDFLKVQTLARLERGDLETLNPTIQAFGRMEGLPMHALAARVRLEG